MPIIPPEGGRQEDHKPKRARDPADPGEQPIQTASWLDLEDKIGSLEYELRPWLPRGILTGLVGCTKHGKSNFALHLTASITNGWDWFDGTANTTETGCVLWSDCEGASALNIDRARRWRLDMSRIKTPFSDPLERLDIEDPVHIDRIVKVITRYGCRLAIIDSFRGAHSSNENSSRMIVGLNALADISQTTKCVLLLLHHTGRLPRNTELTANHARGSSVYIAMMRMLIGVQRFQTSKNAWRKVSLLDENIGLMPPAIGFQICDDGLNFGAPPQPPWLCPDVNISRPTRIKEAVGALEEIMQPAGNWNDRSMVVGEMEKRGFNARMAQRAAKRLRVQIESVRIDGRILKTTWRLVPEDRDPAETTKPS
jgi:hypothetical protein